MILIMFITQSSTSLQSQHVSHAYQSQQSTVRAWTGSDRPDFEHRSTASTPGTQASQAQPRAGVIFSLTDVARLALERWSHTTAMQAASSRVHPTDTGGTAAVAATDTTGMDPRMQMLIKIIETLTGRPVRVFDASALSAHTGTAQVAATYASASAFASSATAAPAQTSGPTPAGWGLEVDTQMVLHETETTQVSARGEVHTADGQTIAFDLQLKMNRSMTQTFNSSVRSGDAVRQDPLVLNFDGQGAALTDTRFSFDLNADGQSEQMAFVAGGSGFLAWDKNGDGRVNNGSELFGPQSGDGFADLAKLDSDGNQWIDSHDPAFAQLHVWQRDAAGADQLKTLEQAGVGALYLGNVASPFTVKTASGQTQGQVRSTGVFLTESGQAGTLQQVDL